ncbi:MAG: hypothetical protein HXS44_00765 [Theionarchaea archaeon]|nr:hypothetical protein [Theionarchaea archaeon]
MILIIIPLIVLTSTAGHSGNCTVFAASYGNTILFGNNEDVGDRNATVWFVPETETANGWVYFGFLDYPSEDGRFPMGGMNDQGLCFDITSVPKSQIRYYPDKLRIINAGIFGGRILEYCATVEEAIEFVERYDQSSLGEYQFLFADKIGDSMILCPGTDKEMKVIRKEGVHQVITNFNVLNPNLGGYPCWRYSAASGMLSKIKSEDDLTVEYVTSVLKASYTRHTTYSTIYDPVNGIAYLYNNHNFDEVCIFNLEEELKKGYHTYYVPSLFPEDEPEDLESSEEPEKSQEEKETQESDESLVGTPESEEPEMTFTPISEPGISLTSSNIRALLTTAIITFVAVIAIILKKENPG